MITVFADTLRKQIREQMNDYADDVATGACETFEEYKRLCGVIEGLATAERFLLDLREKVEKDADE
jgi:hypothetical protein